MVTIAAAATTSRGTRGSCSLRCFCTRVDLREVKRQAGTVSKVLKYHLPPEPDSLPLTHTFIHWMDLK